MTDYDRKATECLGILESIAAKIRKDMETGHIRKWAAIGDLSDVCRVISDIEDRVYQTGEYAS